MKKDILKIANECRAWAEEYASEYPREFDKSLGCFCAIGASYLSERLKSMGIDNQLALFDDKFMAHCFVIVDKYIVDITATQFNSDTIRKGNKGENLKSVEIRKKDDINYNFFDFWKITATFSDYKSLLAHQQKTNWPKAQRLDGHKKLRKSLYNKI